MRHISQSKDCKSYYGPDFDEQKKVNNRNKVQRFRERNGTRKELDQQKKSYASDPELQEKKRLRYEKEKEELRIWKEQQVKKRRKENAEYSLKNYEKLARDRNSECLKWVKNSFEKSFQEYKSWSSTVKEKIVILEKSIEENFVAIESQIDIKVEEWKKEMAKEPDDIRILFAILKEFTTGIKSLETFQKPLKQQNKIDIIWHDLKQTIEVQLDEISTEKEMPKEEIPWHTPLYCHVCQIYRDSKTGVKFFPPRYAS